MKFPERSEGSGGKNFIRLKDKESIVGVFRGELVEFHQHWATNRSIICPGRDTCALCKEGKKAAYRFRLNFVTKENTGYVMKIFEQGWTFCEQLKALNADYPLEKNAVKIMRHGSSMNDTTYTVLPVPNGAVKSEQESVFSALPLHNLDPFKQGEDKDGDETEGVDERFTEEALPF